MMNKLLSLSLAALLCLVTTAVTAKESQEKKPLDWYDVEVIIFRHHDLEALSHEKWKRDPGTPDIRDARELLPPLPVNLSAAQSAKLQQPLAFLQLRDDQCVLNDKFQELQQAKGYNPLIHIAWRQPGLGPDDAITVHIHGGINGTLQADVTQPGDDSNTGQTPPADQQTAPEQTEESNTQGPPAPYIDGTIKLIRQRFLHVDVDLLYRAPYIDDPANPLTREQWPQAFRLTESRRMRSRVLHYLDNPMFGVLIIATPYEPTTPDTEAQPQGQTTNADTPPTTREIQENQGPLSGTIHR